MLNILIKHEKSGSIFLPKSGSNITTKSRLLSTKIDHFGPFVTCLIPTALNPAFVVTFFCVYPKGFGRAGGTVRLYVRCSEDRDKSRFRSIIRDLFSSLRGSISVFSEKAMKFKILAFWGANCFVQPFTVVISAVQLGKNNGFYPQKKQDTGDLRKSIAYMDYNDVGYGSGPVHV